MNKLQFFIVLLMGLVMQIRAQNTPEVNYIQGSATYELSWSDELPSLKELYSEIKINSKWVKVSAFEKIHWEIVQVDRISYPNDYKGALSMLRMTAVGHPMVEQFIIDFEIVEGRPYIVLKTSLIAKEGLTLGGINVWNSNGANLQLNGGKEDWMIFTENAAAPHTGQLMYPDMLLTDVVERGRFSKAKTGVWLTMLANEDDNISITMASIEGELWPMNFEWNVPDASKKKELRLNARNGAIYEKEEVYVPAGKKIIGDAFMIGGWEGIRPTQALANTGKVMGENVRKGKPMRRPAPGWSSWHSNGRDFDEAKVISAAEFMAKEMKSSGWNNIQVDGGWWLEQGLYYVNENFPKGIRYLSNTVADKGLDFGLHISPLRVNFKDPVVLTNRSMVLQPYEKQIIDLDDDEMLTTIGAVYVDTSHPEVPAFLAGRFQTMVDAYKPTFMKWDHHYGALEEGIRKDSTMTFLQGHNHTIRTIRAALPEDLIITRSMGYLFGALECYDAIRIGNDINHPGTISEEEPWAAIDFGKTNGSIRDPQEGKGLIRFARQASQNYYVHNNIAICDPDAFFVSPDYTVDEAKCHMTLQAIMGGLFFIGDRLETLPEERLEIANNQEMFKINAEGIHAIPLDLFSGIDIPKIWKSELEGRTIVTVYNWMDKASSTSFDLGDDFEMNEKNNYKIKELWTQKTVSLKRNKLTLKQAPHSVMVLEFKNK